MKKIWNPLVTFIFIMALTTLISSQQTVYADMHGGGGEPCPESGVWPAGCVPHDHDHDHDDSDHDHHSGEPCPESGVWPEGCVPGGGEPNGSGEACPESGVWPAGCVPGGGGGSSAGGGAGQPCPESGAWPAGCVPGGSGSSSGAGQPCPTSGAWPPGCVPPSSGSSGGSSGESGAVCSIEWKFDVAWPCPTGEIQFGAIAEQPFENGRMIWVEAEGAIFVLFDDGSADVFEDTFDESVDPISDPSIVAPDGLRQPTYGFGKLWRENPFIRLQLGWALESEFNFVGYNQGAVYENADGINVAVVYINGADGFVWKVTLGVDSNWQKTTMVNPI